MRNYIFIMLLFFLFTCISTDKLKKIAENDNLKKTVNVVKKSYDAVRDFTPEEEYYIGRSAAAYIITKYGLYTDKQVTQYVNMVGNSLVLESPRPYLYNGYYFLVLNDEKNINAYATPGGHIFITKALLKLCDNEDELAAVLAHEIAHICNKDAINSISKTKKIEAIKSIVDFTMEKVTKDKEKFAKLTNIFNDISGIVTKAILNGYSRKQEDKADKLGIRIVNNAGYSPLAFVNIIKKLPNNLKGHYKAHRNKKDRIRIINSELKKLSDVNKDILDFRKKRFKKNIKL